VAGNGRPFTTDWERTCHPVARWVKREIPKRLLVSASDIEPTVARGKRARGAFHPSRKSRRVGEAPPFTIMKASLLLLLVPTATPVFLGTAIAVDQPRSQASAAVSAPVQPRELELTVDISPGMRPVASNEITEIFARHVAAALRQQGAEVRPHLVKPPDTPASNQPHLTVTLIEWRPDIAGDVNCTFSATLVTPQGKKELGLFAGTSELMFARPGWFVLSDQYNEAARRALSDLGQRLAQTHLLGL
jgi:hypothetical protein